MLLIKALCVIVEVLCCLLLIGIILLQKSKGEGLGLAFGAGAGESMFGARAGNVLSKATVVLGIVFMANTLFLGVLYAQKDNEKSLMDGVPAQQSAPAQAIELDLGATEIETVPVVEIPVEAAEGM